MHTLHWLCVYVRTSAVGGCESLCLEASGVDCRGKLVRRLSITTDPLSGEGPGAMCVHREEIIAYCCKCHFHTLTSNMYSVGRFVGTHYFSKALISSNPQINIPPVFCFNTVIQQTAL